MSSSTPMSAVLSRIKTMSVRFVGYCSSLLCLGSALIGLYTIGYLVVIGAETGRVFGTLLMTVLASGGGSLLFFAVGKAVFKVVAHPSWILELTAQRDSILHR